MKAGIIFTGSGPILILMSYDSFLNQDLAVKLVQKGIKKFIACEVDLGLCQKRYGQHFEAIRKDLLSSDDMRVLDYNGHNVFYMFSFKELGPPQYKEMAD
ncbi:MAG: hypothetical protein AB1641_23040 [Thermodesulfobacteriota bacterium]